MDDLVGTRTRSDIVGTRIRSNSYRTRPGFPRIAHFRCVSGRNTDASASLMRDVGGVDSATTVQLCRSCVRNDAKKLPDGWLLRVLVTGDGLMSESDSDGSNEDESGWTSESEAEEEGGKLRVLFRILGCQPRLLCSTLRCRGSAL